MKIMTNFCVPIIALLVIIPIMISCNAEVSLDGRVDNALKLAGENRVELKKVLDHYRDDSLKYEAARFLIANMPGHYSYADTAKVNEYYGTVDSLIKRTRGIKPSYLKDSIIELENLYRPRQFSKRTDIEFITADYLIKNIDMAFETWHMSPYCRHLGFDDFCEYILPYKSSELQSFDNWREDYTNMFSDSLRLTRCCSTFKNSSFRAAETFNHCLIDSFHPTAANISMPFLPYRLSTQLLLPFGTCDDFCRVAVPLFRSAGIPVMHDYVPRWGYASSSHSWLVVKAQTGKNIAFVPFYGNPKEQHKIDETKAKVYRRTYSANLQLQQLNESREWIPPTFRNIFQRDVTTEYVDSHTVTIDIDNPVNHYAYLAVSHNKGWDPIAFAPIENRKATFADLGADCVYIPIIYNRDGTPTYISAPFILDLNGSIRHFTTSTDSHMHATLYRKSPLLEYAWDVAVNINNSETEASDRDDFKNYITVGTVNTPVDHAGEIIVNKEIGARRYWRFIKRDSMARCDVAELVFYDRSTGKRLYGKVYQSPSTHRHAKRIQSYLFDNNMLRAFTTSHPGEAWVAVDFGHPVDIEKIQYTPRGDGNTIEPGDEYELYYWDRSHWTSLGRKTATTISIDFDNIPAGALLLLRDLTKGKDERIFTLSDTGQQIFH